ncbi:hypothetical protein JCM8097_005082 [Rhodosporidiobolus ruineniae]
MGLAEFLHLQSTQNTPFFPSTRKAGFSPLSRLVARLRPRPVLRTQPEYALQELGHRNGQPYEPPEVLYGRASAWNVLDEKLLAWRGEPVLGASRNTGDAMKTVSVNYLLKHWSKVFPDSFSMRYIKAIEDVPDKCTTDSFLRCDIVLTNVLSPVVEILNQLISPLPQHRHLEVVIQRQPTRSFEASIYNEAKGLHVRRTITVRMDHAITLGDSQAIHPGIVAPKRTYMVSCEEKRPIDAIADSYMRHFQCRHFFLTDYRDGVAVFLNPNGRVTKGKGGVALEGINLSPHVTVGEAKKAYATLEGNPMDGRGGLRHAVCMLAVHAMHELGVLNTDLFPDLPALKDPEWVAAAEKKNKPKKPSCR